jgi:hypothetical protein
VSEKTVHVIPAHEIRGTDSVIISTFIKNTYNTRRRAAMSVALARHESAAVRRLLRGSFSAHYLRNKYIHTIHDNQ